MARVESARCSKTGATVASSVMGAYTFAFKGDYEYSVKHPSVPVVLNAVLTCGFSSDLAGVFALSS